MSDDDAARPTPRLRPSGTSADPAAGPAARPAARPDAREARRPDPRPGATRPDDARPGGRAVPVRAVLLAALVVLVVLAAFRSSGLAAVVGVPLALTVPGAVLQLRFLPGLGTDVLTSRCLWVGLSLATWALVALAVGAAGIPVRSVWTVVVAVVLLAAVVVGEPSGDRRFGWLPARRAGWGAAAIVVAVGLTLGGRALVAVAGGSAGPTTPVAVTVAFTDPTTPFALTATGAQATARVVVTNAGGHALHLTFGGGAGRGLAWTTVTADVPAGATRVVAVTGDVPVCSDPQQAVVTVAGAGKVAPLSAVLPGTDGAPRCGAS